MPARGEASSFDEADDERSGPLRRLGQQQGIGAAAGLRGGDEHGAGEVELAAIDRGEAGAERGDGQAERALDQVFAIARGMVGGATRAGRDEGRALDAQACDEIGDDCAIFPRAGGVRRRRLRPPRE
jgi:hypothetical protein